MAVSAKATLESVTAEEYLATERASVGQPRCEFVEGIAYAMAGASISHNRIVANLGGQLYNGLRNRPCEHFPPEMKIHLEATGGFAYPDASALCGPVATYDEHADIIENPAFIAEVLSPSTEAYDRGKKFDHYRKIPTFSDYLLIAQDRLHADIFTRQNDDSWKMLSFSEEEATIPLASLGIEIPLGSLYENVEFPPPSAPVNA